MALHDYEPTWSSAFDNQDSYFEKKENSHSNTCHVSELPRPCPQRSSFDSSFQDSNCFDDHYLEKALKDMSENGELEDFLRANTVSLKDIQDDMNVHYGRKPHAECESLRVRRHSIGTADEIIQCPFPGCGKIFNRSYNFKSHFKIHTGDKPFKCADCNLCFARSHDLKRHEKIHRKDENCSCKCDNCGKSFSRSDALNRHIRLNSCQKNIFKP